MPENYLTPETKRERHFTQVISLIVGVLLTIIGLAGILFPAFAGLHMSVIYSPIVAFAGITLFINGFKNKGREAFLTCAVFSVFFGLHALAGFIFGKPGIPEVGFDAPDPQLLRIIPGVHEVGKVDHILNTILSLVLLGGAIDWWRRNTDKGHRREMPQEFRTRRNIDDAIRH